MAKMTAEERKLAREYSKASAAINSRAGWIIYQNAREVNNLSHVEALDLALAAE